ncbi:MAG: hypothetical protein U9R40_07165, partial [Synergistota bacterium]|nr:hypothetical protein [Synergistota bacterium]
VSYCPTPRGLVESALPEGAGSVLEIVIDGLDDDSVAEAMRKGIEAACIDGVLQVTAGNYGGSLGDHIFRLHDILGGKPAGDER